MESESPLESIRQRIGVEEACRRLVASEDRDALRPAIEAILLSPGAAHGMRDLASLAGLSPQDFTQRFKRILGYGPFEFHDRVRVDAALLSIAESDRSVQEISEEFEFLDPNTFDLSVAEYTGLPLPAILSLLRP